MTQLIRNARPLSHSIAAAAAMLFLLGASPKAFAVDPCAGQCAYTPLTKTTAASTYWKGWIISQAKAQFGPALLPKTPAGGACSDYLLKTKIVYPTGPGTYAGFGTAYDDTMWYNYPSAGRYTIQGNVSISTAASGCTLCAADSSGVARSWEVQVPVCTATATNACVLAFLGNHSNWCALR
jgi:hypothetical protein